MLDIATLTLNPTVDLSFEVDRIYPIHKMRGSNERHDPGGGGINVARVLVRLGANARCHYMSGGAAGAALDHLLDLHQLVKTRVPIAGETRISTSVLERESGKEYRFTTDGPEIASDEWMRCLAQLNTLRNDYLVLSGSLPRGVPDDIYAQAAALAARNDVRVVLDSSGRGLSGGLSGPEIFLAKPSIGELRALVGKELESDESIIEAADAIIARGAARHIAVTMGREGAILVSAGRHLRLPALPVKVQSAVGAGDSFLAAMVFALAQGKPIEEAFHLGVAAGAAAVLSPGTGLARADDILRLAGSG
ncbi:1-phosphofructokinase family hexose kinase [Qipengyuania zhejiangensis]|uniref:1-phosphofructokinase family hexose kinase n=1 Tax=Qipengyuania zhejiangensis TaxID=3077782 RepID=UPI002D79FCB9|nr:hexose kinase [Qipengyuania sp. Z2]